MLPVSAPFETVNSRLHRTPIYKVNFTSWPREGLGGTGLFATAPVAIIRESIVETDSVDEHFAIDEHKPYDEFLPFPFIDQSHIGDIFHQHFFTYTATAAKPYASRFESLQGQVYPEQGHSSVGAVAFTLTDRTTTLTRSGDITFLVMEGLLGERTELYAGFDDIDEDDYLLFFTGMVGAIRTPGTLAAYEITVYSPQSLLNRDVFNVVVTSLKDDINSDISVFIAVMGESVGASHYVLVDQEIIHWDAFLTESETNYMYNCTRGALGTVAVEHKAGAEVREVIVYQDHPMQILLGVLMNENNTGCGLPPEFVDQEAISAAIEEIGSIYQMAFHISEPENAMEWIEREIMRPLGCYPVTRSDGKYSIVVFRPPALEDAVGAIDHQSIVHDGDEPMLEWSLGRDGSLGEVINDITFRYDYNAGTGQFLATAQFERPESIARFGRKPMIIESKGLRSALANTTTLILHRAIEILNRYEAGVPLVRLTTFLHQLRIEPGDIVELSSALLPSGLTKQRGIDGELMECVNRNIRFDQGQVDFDLLWTGFRLMTADAFNRGVDVDWTEANDLLSEGAWATAASTAADIQIVDNKLALSYHGVMVRTAVHGNNQVSQLSFMEVLGDGGRSGPAVRLAYTVDAGGLLETVSGYAAMYDSPDNRIILRYFPPGSDPTSFFGVGLGQYPATLAFDDRLRLEARGPNFYVYLNSTLILTAYHESASTGQPGVLANINLPSPDGLVWDDWHGGDSGWA